MPRARGGGRGRGRGGRGRGRSGNRGRGGRSVANTQQAVDDWGIDTSANSTVSLDNQDAGLEALFVSASTVDQHYDAQVKDKDGYLATMLVLEKNGVEILQGSRIRALAAAWARKDHSTVSAFLAQPDQFGLVEILKALTLLDSGRRVREFEKKMRRLEMQGKVKKKTLGKLKSNIDNLNAVKPKVGSVSGAVARHVQRWVKTLSESQLEFYALHFPKEPWKRLADICHFHPERDFPTLPWFLRYCYGGDAPDGSMVQSCGNLNKDNVNELVLGHNVPYAHIKAYKSNLTLETKARIATYETELDTLLWYYEDLACEATDQVILDRLKRGDPVNLPYGKLMERLLTLKMLRDNISGTGYGGGGFATGSKATEASLKKAPFYDLLVPIAEKQLQNISVPLEAPVVVIGDASPSMNVAIRTSTIIASLLSAIAHAKLVFFHSFLMEPPFLPENVSQALELATTVQTAHMTAPAAGLYDFYDKKEVVKTFIIVTDEEENLSYKNYRFTELFKKYREEVYPARLVFVSFLPNQHSKGRMVQELAKEGITCLQFKLDSNRPDLTKLDNLLGIMSTDSANFSDQVRAMATKMKAQGVARAFQNLKVGGEPTDDGADADPQTTASDDDEEAVLSRVAMATEQTSQADEMRADGDADDGERDTDTADPKDKPTTVAPCKADTTDGATDLPDVDNQQLVEDDDPPKQC